MFGESKVTAFYFKRLCVSLSVFFSSFFMSVSFLLLFHDMCEAKVVLQFIVLRQDSLPRLGGLKLEAYFLD